VLDTLKEKTSWKRSKNGGVCGTGIYMREGNTSGMMAADRPYGFLFFFIFTASDRNILDNISCRIVQDKC
jgi:hypothetical protein